MKFENTSEMVSFEDSYPFDLTKYQKTSFLNLEDFGTIVKKEEYLMDIDSSVTVKQRYFDYFNIC